ncbi:MAG TPA: peptidase M48 [Deltaproteobacteria bacterium]|nr:peptidase M48 [Deltaproteobacteria bacterium]
MRRLATTLTLGAALAGCDGETPINLFTIEDDISLGMELRDEINGDPATYPVVPEADAPDAYDHLYRMRDAILASGEVTHADDFDWEIYLIDDDETLNAFAGPGGYIWVYSGIMRYLEREDDLVGVLGHEIAHADRRHSTQQLSKVYGVSVLLGVIFGSDPGLIPELAAGLVSLSFSRTDEADADEHSVIYLCGTDYAANGAASFFEKLLEESTVEIPAFLSTHPASAERVADINTLTEELGCSTDPNPNVPPWADVLATLP